MRRTHHQDQSNVSPLIEPWMRFQRHKHPHKPWPILTSNYLAFHLMWVKPSTYIEVSINGGTPKMDGIWWFIIENAIKMDDLGYPYFRKPPYRWCILVLLTRETHGTVSPVIIHLRSTQSSRRNRPGFTPPNTHDSRNERDIPYLRSAPHTSRCPWRYPALRPHFFRGHGFC